MEGWRDDEIWDMGGSIIWGGGKGSGKGKGQSVGSGPWAVGSGQVGGFWS